MKYEFETNKRDFSDFSSGRVLYNAANTTAFPVRLASEIIQRSFDILEKKGALGPFKIYDPCCGGGFLLTTIGFLYYNQIFQLIATDYDNEVLETARKNLSLLSREGLDKRKEEIKGYIKAFGKDSHKQALNSIDHLGTLIGEKNIKISCMQRDITDMSDYPIKEVNIIITDIPYGNIVNWVGVNQNPIQSLFENCYKALDKKRSVLVIVADKKSKLVHKSFRRIQQFKLGKRQIAFFEPLY
jgi:23S rRNA G2445 N2-methylase RlmL